MIRPIALEELEDLVWELGERWIAAEAQDAAVLRREYYDALARLEAMNDSVPGYLGCI